VDNIQRTREWFRHVDAKDFDWLSAHVDADVDFRAPGAEGNAEMALSFMKPFLAAFPDITHTVRTAVSDGDRVMVELEIAGTHKAPLVSPDGEIPPTGRRVVFGAANSLRFEGDKIALMHVYFDQVGFMAQLGLLPAAASTN
jgi:predicted ester cyclase